jgi:hypothetical protein
MATTKVDIGLIDTSGTASSGTFLRGDGAWQAAGGGKVLQVVHTAVDGHTNSASTSYVATVFLAAITPTASDSKILVIGAVSTGMTHLSSGGYIQGGFQWYRDIGGAGFSGVGQEMGYTNYQNTGHYYEGKSSFTILDSPTTTSAVTYKMYHKADSGHTAYTNYSPVSGEGGTITMIEIGA